MPYTKPYIDGDTIPEQPIPLRLVPFITDWTVIGMLDLLTTDEAEHRLTLSVYEYYDGREPREVGITTLFKLKQDTTEDMTRKEQLQKLRHNYFVMSSELEDRFNWYIQHFFTPEDLPRHSSLLWNATPGQYLDEIDACSDFYDLLPTPQRRLAKKRRRNKNTTEIYKIMCEHAEFLRDKNSRLSKGDIAMHIERKPELNPRGVKARQIQRILQKECKKFGI